MHCALTLWGIGGLGDWSSDKVLGVAVANPGSVPELATRS
jgi:hypothetical protein